MNNTANKVVNLSQLEFLCDDLKKHGHILVLTSGCFDLLHSGHVEYIDMASNFGHLIIGINSDNFVKKLKGEFRPIQDEDNRSKTIAGLENVKLVTIFNDDMELIKAVKPNIYVSHNTARISIWDDKERIQLLDQIGATIKELRGKKDSSTDIIKRAAMSYKNEKIKK